MLSSSSSQYLHQQCTWEIIIIVKFFPTLSLANCKAIVLSVTLEGFIIRLPSTREYDQRATFWLQSIRLLPCACVFAFFYALCNCMMVIYEPRAQIMHEAVTGHVEAKKLLSHWRQLDDSTDNTNDNLLTYATYAYMIIIQAKKKQKTKTKTKGCELWGLSHVARVSSWVTCLLDLLQSGVYMGKNFCWEGKQAPCTED